MVSKPDNKQVDVDIPQGKRDILRAKDIIPSSVKDKPADPNAVDANHVNIPNFDLAEQIMAEHRKIAAIKRQKPGKKIEAQTPLAQKVSPSITPPRPEQNQIIVEIVARDIKKLRELKGKA